MAAIEAGFRESMIEDLLDHPPCPQPPCELEAGAEHDARND
jgi:hypothetical protein